MAAIDLLSQIKIRENCYFLCIFKNLKTKCLKNQPAEKCICDHRFVDI